MNKRYVDTVQGATDRRYPGMGLLVAVASTRGRRGLVLQPAAPCDVLPITVVASGEVAPAVESLGPGLTADDDALKRLFAEAKDAGLVEAAPGPDGDDRPRVTLTAKAMLRLGVRPSDRGLYWTADAELSSTSRRPPFGSSSPRNSPVNPVDPDRFDRRHDPAAFEAHLIYDATEKAEELAGKIKNRRQDGLAERAVPNPSVLVGQRLQWPPSASRKILVRLRGLTRKWGTSVETRARDDAEPCESCRGRLRPHEYCLWCDDYGRAWMLPIVSKFDQGDPGREKAEAKGGAEVEVAATARDAGLKGGLDGRVERRKGRKTG